MTTTALTFAATTSAPMNPVVVIFWVVVVVAFVVLAVVVKGRQERQQGRPRSNQPQVFTKVVQGYRNGGDNSRRLERKVTAAVRSANARGYELIGKTTRYNGMGRGGTDVVLTFQRVMAQR
jgi:hypothetical protein